MQLIKTNFVVSLMLLLSSTVGLTNSSVIFAEEPAVDYTGLEYLDNNLNYLVKWNISNAEKTIYFEITAKTTGFVGFGISPKGGMTGADILIAGVYANKTIYSMDYHAEANAPPIQDSQNDWVITEAREADNVTTLRFHRLLSTCDSDDLEITDGTMRLIWALGETDTVAYHNYNRGTKSVNFYLQDEHEFQPEKFDTMDLVVNMTMPALHTTYWCTFHRAPLFNETQHIVAFDAVLNNSAAIQHTHHFSIYRCIVPDDQDSEAIFEPWVNSSGDHCYAPFATKFPYSQYCSRTPVYIWSKGGKRLAFPDNMGLPMPEKLNKREYYALEVHYDNPQVIANLTFPTGGRIFYTNKTREIEAGLLIVDHSVDPTLTVPPKVSDFIVSGHCSSECTETYFPAEGITIFNNLFHAHLAGRKLKLRHFRGEEELSWVDVDDYYDFNFQQNKPLKNPRVVRKGDQLTVECTYDSRSAEDGKVVIGGLSSREEMCEAIVYYYPRLPMLICGSSQDFNLHMSHFGITNYTYKNMNTPGVFPEVEILEPASMAGDYRDSVTANVNWTREFLQKYQDAKRYGEHIGICIFDGVVHQGPVKYPERFSEYVPPNQCDASGSDRIVAYLQFVLECAFIVKLLS